MQIYPITATLIQENPNEYFVRYVYRIDSSDTPWLRHTSFIGPLFKTVAEVLIESIEMAIHDRLADIDRLYRNPIDASKTAFDLVEVGNGKLFDTPKDVLEAMQTLGLGCRVNKIFQYQPKQGNEKQAAIPKYQILDLNLNAYHHSPRISRDRDYLREVYMALMMKQSCRASESDVTVQQSVSDDK